MVCLNDCITISTVALKKMNSGALPEFIFLSILFLQLMHKEADPSLIMPLLLLFFLRFSWKATPRPVRQRLRPQR